MPKKSTNEFRLTNFLTKTKKLIVIVISIIILLFTIVYTIRSVFDKKIVIRPITIPESMIESGYSDKVLSQMYLDEIRMISSTAQTFL